MLRRIIIITLFIASPAFAQQASPEFNAAAVAILQQQRNNAMDALAVSETNRRLLAEEMAKLKVEIDDLKKAKQEQQK